VQQRKLRGQASGVRREAVANAPTFSLKDKEQGHRPSIALATLARFPLKGHVVPTPSVSHTRSPSTHSLVHRSLRSPRSGSGCALDCEGLVRRARVRNEVGGPSEGKGQVPHHQPRRRYVPRPEFTTRAITWVACCCCGDMVTVTLDEGRRYARHESCFLCVVCAVLTPPDDHAAS
jgi:hypothetical protein